MTGRDEATWERLHQIAAVLGMSVEQFLHSLRQSDSEIEKSEYLALWAQIRTAQGRRRALASLRAVIDGEER